MSVAVPSFYEPVPILDVEREAEVGTTRPVDHDADDLPFSKLDGRRFEILAYHLTSNTQTSPGTVVTLVKASGDQGRDVTVHVSGTLATIIQCKNHMAPVSRPALLQELVKLLLFNLQEKYLPNGVVTYELWAPGGASGPVEKLLTEWPNSVDDDEIRRTFETVTKKYTSLSAVKWGEQENYVLDMLRSPNPAASKDRSGSQPSNQGRLPVACTLLPSGDRDVTGSL